MNASNVTVGTSAVLLVTASVPHSSGGQRVLVKNNSANVLYLGGSGVTTTTGFHIAANSSAELTLYAGDSLFGVASAAGTDVRVLTSP